MSALAAQSILRSYPEIGKRTASWRARAKSPAFPSCIIRHEKKCMSMTLSAYRKLSTNAPVLNGLAVHRQALGCPVARKHDRRGLGKIHQLAAPGLQPRFLLKKSLPYANMRQTREELP